MKMTPEEVARINAHTIKMMSILTKMEQSARKQAQDEVMRLRRENAGRGGSSYRQYDPVYYLAGRYYRRILVHNTDYFPGKAATTVRKHCLKSDKFKYVPSQERIKNFLKENKPGLIKPSPIK